MSRLLLVREGERAVEAAPEELSERGERPAWLDITDPEANDLALVADELGLHPLAVEDALSGHDRPKVDEYATHYFVIWYAVERVAAQDLRFTQVAAFVARNAIVTAHRGDFRARGAAERRWRDGVLREPGALLHALLDGTVDDYFPLVDELGERVDALEALIADDRGDRLRDSLRELFRLKRELLRVRQRVAPGREVLAALARDDLGLFPGDRAAYFQDVYDHVVRVTDEIDTFRDLTSNVIDAYLAATSNRLNEVMKVLTSVATVLLVITVVTSFFGQNFAAIPYGSNALFWGSVAVTAIASLALVLWFRRVGWL